MSVQVGIHYFNGRDVCCEEIEFLLHGLNHRGPDYTQIRTSRSLGMGFRGLLIAPEDKEDQPILGTSQGLITLDGRLDNRDEIALQLGIQLSESVSDPMLALTAYERWGTDSFCRLQGEIACVVWDERTRTLFLFRSLCGTRPLFYIASQERIIWSSELDDLVIKSGIDPIVNDDYAIGYAYYQPDIDESPFSYVSTVPCGTYIEIKSTGKVNLPVAVWHPERISTLLLRSEKEYDEAWRYQVENAITKKLRTRHPAFCELSGGLDSTTLVLMADRVLRKMARSPSELTTVSLTFETSTTCDESHFIRIAETVRGCPGIHIPESVQQPTFGLKDIAFTGAPNAYRFTPGRYRAIARFMKIAGARVLFTGTGGDHLFWSDQGGSPELADLLVGWHLSSLISQGCEWSRAARIPLWQILLSHALWPMALTTPFAAWLPSDIDTFPWITKKARECFARRGLDQGIRANKYIALPSRRVRETVIRSFRALLSAGYFQGLEEIYFSHPYSNQQLIDFVLSLPMNQLACPGRDRVLMRRATQGLLPEPIRTRKTKTTIDEIFSRVLERERHEIGDPRKFEVCQRGYAAPNVLAKEMVRIAIGRMDHSSSLFRLMNIEQWLRSLETIGARRQALKKEQRASPDRVASSSSDSIRHSTSTSPLDGEKEELCTRHPRWRPPERRAI